MPALQKRIKSNLIPLTSSAIAARSESDSIIRSLSVTFISALNLSLYASAIFLMQASEISLPSKAWTLILAEWGRYLRMASRRPIISPPEPQPISRILISLPSASSSFSEAMKRSFLKRFPAMQKASHQLLGKYVPR